MGTTESVLVVDGMHCAACAPAIEAALRLVAGVERAEVDGASRRARVRWSAGGAQVAAALQAIQALGYRARPAQVREAHDQQVQQQRAALWRLFVAGFCMMQVMMYATPAYVAAPGEITPDIDALLRWASWLLTLPVVLFCARPWWGGAWAQLRQRRIGMDVPVAVGIAVTFIASTGAAFAPGGVFGHEVYFDSLAMFVFFLLGGRWLELRARHATLGALDALTQRVPDRVERLLDGHATEIVPAAALRVDDRVRVRPGQAFPADGVLEPGSTTQVDEALLSGESLPLRRGSGEPVLAGSVNLSAPVVLRVQRIGADTRYAQIVALIERATSERPAMVRAADRVAQPFLLVVLLLAAGAAAVWSLIDPSRSVWVAVSVLIVTCPCALSLAAPSALVTATGALARRGVLLQRMGALEMLARADVFVFDKTGTLTQDRLALAGVQWLDESIASDALPAGLALAQASLHPTARALCAAWSDAAPAALSQLTEHAGQGVEGIDTQGRRWRLGSARFAGAQAHTATSQTSAWLSCDGRVLARLAFDEVLRADAPSALAALHADGVVTWMLSGDRSESAARVGHALHIGEVRSGARPEDKLAAVAALQAQGRRVAMVGDGINDAPVLARADVSIAMGTGADLARQQADLTLLSGRLGDLIAARRLAQRALRVVHQNLAWAALYNAACVPLALLGWLPPWAAGLGMAASSLWVLLNAQRLRRA